MLDARRSYIERDLSRTVVYAAGKFDFGTSKSPPILITKQINTVHGDAPVRDQNDHLARLLSLPISKRNWSTMLASF